MVSDRGMKPLNGDQATAIRIPVVLCGAPGVKPKSSPRTRRGLDASTTTGSPRRRVEKYFFLTSSLIGWVKCRLSSSPLPVGCRAPGLETSLC